MSTFISNIKRYWTKKHNCLFFTGRKTCWKFEEELQK